MGDNILLRFLDVGLINVGGDYTKLAKLEAAVADLEFIQTSSPNLTVVTPPITPAAAIPAARPPFAAFARHRRHRIRTVCISTKNNAGHARKRHVWPENTSNCKKKLSDYASHICCIRSCDYARYNGRLGTAKGLNNWSEAFRSY